MAHVVSTSTDFTTIFFVLSMALSLVAPPQPEGLSSFIYVPNKSVAWLNPGHQVSFLLPCRAMVEVL
jgi:hypothetical protein